MQIWKTVCLQLANLTISNIYGFEPDIEYEIIPGERFYRNSYGKPTGVRQD